MSVNPNSAWINNLTPAFVAPGLAPSGASTSASNVVNYDTGGLAVITVGTAIPNNNFATLFTIPATYFPNANSTYRITVSLNLTTATFASASIGTIAFQSTYNNNIVGNAVCYVNGNIASAGASVNGTFTGVVEAVAGQTLPIFLINNSGVALNTATVTIQNISIVGVSTDNFILPTFTTGG